MSYLNKMYGLRNEPPKENNKNPNRVTGGLKAQNVDKFTMISEDGSQQDVPTLEYVRSLEDQSKKQRAAIDVLERKLARQESALQQLQSAVVNRSQ